MQARLSLYASLVVSSARTTHLFFSTTFCYHTLRASLTLVIFSLKNWMTWMMTLKEFNCKANSILCTFHCADPVVKTFLIQSFCLSLYGGILWKLNTSGINRLEVALNKILRKIWHLPPRSHSVNTVKNLLYYRFLTFLKNTLSSPSPLVRSVFHDTCHLAYFFNGYNSRYGHTHLKFYNDTLYNYADTIRYVRIVHGSRTPFESLVNSLSCF